MAKRLTTFRSRHGHPAHKYYKQATRALRPKIFVNTNFTRHQRKISNSQNDPRKLRPAAHQVEPQYGRFVSLEQLKAADAAALTGRGAPAYVLPQLNPLPTGVNSQSVNGQEHHLQQPHLLAHTGQAGTKSTSDGHVVPQGDSLALGAQHIQDRQQGSTAGVRGNEHVRPRANTAQSLSPYKSPGNPHGIASQLRGSLSPNDRAILIGLSLGHEDTGANVEQQQWSPETLIEDSEVVKESPGHQSVLTPTILITPAREFPAVLGSDALRRLKSRPPVASSVYSRRVSEWLDGAMGAPPPMPAPGEGFTIRSPRAWRSSTTLNGKRESVGTVFEEDDIPLDRSLRGSAQTVLEDESPASALRSHLSPDDAARKDFDGSPVQPESVRHPSAGWWNIIMTPFLTRSNTNASTWPGRDDEPPELPNVVLAAAIAQKYDEDSRRKEENPFSPTTPPVAKADHDRTTAWTDLTRWEEERKAAEARATNHSQSVAKEGTILPGFPSPRPQAAVATDAGAKVFAVAENPSHNAPDPVAQWPLPAAPHRYKPFQPSLVEQSPVQETTKPYATLSPGDREVPVIFNGPVQDSTRDYSEKSEATGMDLDARLTQRPAVPRSDTYATEVDEYRSPTVHQANIAAVVRAGTPVNTALPSQERQQGGRSVRVQGRAPACEPPPYSPPRAQLPPQRSNQAPPSDLSARGVSAQTPPTFQPSAVPSRQQPAPMPGPAFWSAPASNAPQAGAPRREGAWGLPPRPNMLPVTMQDLGPRAGSRQAAEAAESKRRRGDKEDTFARKVGAVLRRMGFAKTNGFLGRSGTQARKRRRCCCGVITAVIIALVLIAVLAVMLSQQNRDSAPQDSRWVNLTDWPPMPTGVYAVVRPDLEAADSGCASPPTLWSCALPKELQQPGSENIANQPTFLFKIDYLQASTPNATKSEGTDLASNISFAATPDPPSLEDQQFIGNTTDGIVSALKEGEVSPFALSLLSDSTQPPARLRRRQEEPESEEEDEFPDIGSSIPPPETNADGSAKAASLFPLSVSQQLRLYDPGLETEHVGFYIYFERSIFLQSSSVVDDTGRGGRGDVPADRNGGSTIDAARARCTWTQTRFLVQIWTRKDNRTRVSRTNATSTSTTPTTIESFPYPVTFTSDRHGGDVTTKMIYCYGIDDRGRLDPDQAAIQLENRGAGGQLVGGGQGPLGKDKVTLAQGGLGGIDGGTGGCACRWDNFATVI